MDVSTVFLQRGKSCVDGKNVRLTGVCRLRKKVVLTVRKKMFQRCFNGKKKIVIQRCFYGEGKRCFNSLSRVRKKKDLTKGNVCFNGVSWVRKKFVSTVTKRMFHRRFKGKKKNGCFNGVFTVGKNVFSRVKERYFNGILTVRTKGCFKGVEK